MKRSMVDFPRYEDLYKYMRVLVISHNVFSAAESTGKPLLGCAR